MPGGGLFNSDSETDEFIELQTLPSSGRRKRQQDLKSNKMSNQKRKGGLAKIFGTKKNVNGNKLATGISFINVLSVII